MHTITEKGHELPDFGEFYDLALDLEGLVPIEVLRKLAQGQFNSETMTLERTFLLYRKHKEKTETDPERIRELEGRLDRLRKDITASLGESTYKHTGLLELRRRDANALRDHMLGRMSPNSVKRYQNILKAAVNYVIREEDVEAKNPFAELQVTGAGASNRDRLPLNEENLQAALPYVQSNPDAELLFWLLTETGARMGEIVGLELQDIDLAAETVHLRPNSVRGLTACCRFRVTRANAQ